MKIMAEYIDREAALNLFSGEPLRIHCPDWYAEKIKALPAAGVVPVVRCAECKHLRVWNIENLYASCPKSNTFFLPFELDTRMHFCSLGERKDGADNG